MGIDPGTNYMGYGVVEVTGRELRSVVMGAIDLHKLTDPYAKLRRIFDRVGALVDEYAPREVALESPFFGENVQSMLKLGRAQGVAMAAALCRDVPVFEYAPHQAVHHGRRGGSQRAGGGTGHPHTGDRLHPQEARRDRRHGRGAVPLLHVVQPAQRRTGRRTQQGAGRRPQGRVGARQQIVGKIPQREPRPRTQTLIRFLRDALPEPFRVHESASPNRHVFRQSSGRCTLFRSVSPADPPF